jgi:GPH family glycoside/pentoside/hexuronide:cation symporter
MAGTIIFLSLIVDAVADPLIGSWSDRSHSRWGRRLPFMVVAVPIICIASLALFSIPVSGETVGAIGLALFLNVLLRVGTSLYAIPYAALTAELKKRHG